MKRQNCDGRANVNDRDTSWGAYGFRPVEVVDREEDIFNRKPHPIGEIRPVYDSRTNQLRLPN